MAGFAEAPQVGPDSEAMQKAEEMTAGLGLELAPLEGQRDGVAQGEAAKAEVGEVARVAAQQAEADAAAAEKLAAQIKGEAAGVEAPTAASGAKVAEAGGTSQEYTVSQYLGTTKYFENGQIEEVFGAARLDGPAMLEAYAKNPLNRYEIAKQLIRDPGFVKSLYEVYRQNPKTSRSFEEFSDSLQRELELGYFDSVTVGDNQEKGEKIRPTTENLNKARQGRE